MIKYLLILFSALSLSACGPTKTTESQNLNIPTPMISSAQNAQNQIADTVVTLKTDYGPIAIKLYQSEAPNTVANFLAKIESGFYSGLNFHRVEPGFVVQGGDPLGNGTGGGKITSEINSIPFKRGSVGLARGSVKSESNDSQFFICLSDESCSHLTNEYVNFGEVLSGMDFVDQIKVGDKIIEITTYTK